MDTGSFWAFCKHIAKKFHWTLGIAFFNFYIFSYFWSKQKRPGKDDDRLLQLVNADDSVFEGYSEDSDEDFAYLEETVELDLDLEEAQEEQLLENTSKVV